MWKTISKSAIILFAGLRKYVMFVYIYVVNIWEYLELKTHRTLTELNFLTICAHIILYPSNKIDDTQE